MSVSVCDDYTSEMIEFYSLLINTLYFVIKDHIFSGFFNGPFISFSLVLYSLKLDLPGGWTMLKPGEFPEKIGISQHFSGYLDLDLELYRCSLGLASAGASEVP